MVMDSEKMNLSLSGCGYLGSYHLGVGSCMRLYAPHILRNKISGASVGALVAAAFACNVPLEKITMTVFDVSIKVRCGVLGPMSPDLNIMQLLYDYMKMILPENAHHYCNGRLFVSVTRYDDCKNVLLSQFDSKEDVLQALMCSCFIPLYCGYDPPEFHGVAYVDGGYSDNSPRLDDSTVVVAPFYGDSEICPNDGSGVFRNFIMNNMSVYITLKNCRRLLRILFPGPPDMLKDVCQKGFNDALRFLRDNGILQCPQCSFGRMEINGNIPNEKTNHEKCEPLEYPLPTEIFSQIDESVQRLSNGIGDRLLKNPVVKVLYYLNMPSIVTMKLSYSLFSAVAKKLHNKASSCVVDVSRDLLHYFREVMQHPKFQSSVHCQIGLNRLDYIDEMIEDMKEVEIGAIEDTQSYQMPNTDEVVTLDLDMKLPHLSSIKLQKSSLYLEENNLKKSIILAQEKLHTNTNYIPPNATENNNGHVVFDILLDNRFSWSMKTEQELDKQSKNGIMISEV